VTPRRWGLVALAVAVTLWATVGVVARSADPATGGPRAGGLGPCPDTPNCVHPEADDPDQRVPTLTCPDTDLADVVTTVEHRLPRAQRVVLDGDYAHLTDTTRWLRFVDDVELALDGDTLHLRSASRLGRDDRGVNARRVREIRTALSDAGQCR
jgi:uncharacterized protein (DUF1499 family)